MTTDYRALRAGYEPGDGSMDDAQLVDSEWWHPMFGCDSLQMVVDRARALLDQQEAEGPTDEELLRLYQVATPCYAVEQYKRELDFARAALARWGRPTPQPPAAGEVAEESWYPDFADWLEREMPEGTVIGDPLWWASKIANRIIAADLLQRQYPQPVAVSERLPGPEDCDEQGRCWLEFEGSDDYEPCWTLRKMYGIPFNTTHWLPANALPTPEPNAAGEVTA